MELHTCGSIPNAALQDGELPDISIGQQSWRNPTRGAPVSELTIGITPKSESTSALMSGPIVLEGAPQQLSVVFA